MVNLKSGFILQFHLTEKCNLRCKHCYQEDKYIKGELDIEGKKRIIDMFGKAIDVWGVHGIINFTGGEPTLKKEELIQLIKYTKKKYLDITIGILSNGTLIDKKLASSLKKAGVNDIQVSLDGATEKCHDFIRGEGNFKKAIAGIKNVVSVGLLGEIMFTLHGLNAEEVPGIINLASQLGAKRLGIERLVPIGRGKEEIPNSVLDPKRLHDIYLDIGKKKQELKNKLVIATNRPLWCLIGKELHSNEFKGSCAAGFSTLTVMPNGDVMPCRRMNMVIGNLKEKNLFDVWYSSDILWKLRERKQNFIGCGKCENLNLCGGCRAVAYGMTGNYLAKDPQCWKK